jgi:predicted Ser/Thr protein kinase
MDDDPDSTASRSAPGPARAGPGNRFDEPTVISARPPAGPVAASSADIGRNLLGTMLGPYRLEQFIGGGGMGAVFRGHDTTLDRVVAVKVLAGRQSDDEDMLRRFRNEAQSAARLDHENIGRVYAVGSEQGWHYIVFEFIEGRNLRDLVREEGPFDVARTIDVAVQVADALEHASQRAVVHRDIKPSNIVITPAGRARVVDMGLARLHQMAGDHDLTMSGMTLGTFDYISPEQARDPRAADVRSDLYSLGCTMFYLLVGRPPFAEGTMVQKLLQHQQEPPPPLEDVRPDVPRRLAAIVARLMAKDPGDRHQRPAELVADLVACADAEGIGLAGPRPALAPTQPVRRERPAALPWLVPVLGLAATVGWLWFDELGRRRPEPSIAPEVASPMVPGGGPPLAISPGPTVIRVGDPEAGLAADERSFAEAVAIAADGDTLELAFDGRVDTTAFALAGRQLVVRAAAGRRPGLRFTSTLTSRGGTAVACDIADGALELRDVALELEAAAPVSRGGGGFGGGVPAVALFALGAGSLACDTTLLDLRDDALDGPASGGPVAGRAAVVSVELPPDDLERTGAGIRMAAVRAIGDAVMIDVQSGGRGRVDLVWVGGGVVTPRQFLATTGGPFEIEAELVDATFACRDGMTVLRDGGGTTGLATISVTSRNCDFFTAGAPLITQTGVADPADYEPRVTWRNRGSRHEGTDVFRRIDGAAERIDMFFRDQPAAFRHASRVQQWPAAEAWRADWWDRAD